MLTLHSGPNWIHGSHNNPILDLANETNSTVVSPELGESVVFDESGHQLSEQTGQEISGIVWGIIDDAFKYSNEDSATIPPERSLMDFFRKRVEEMKLDRYTSKLVLQCAQIWGDYVGEPTETQSLKYMWLEECIDDGWFFLLKSSAFLTPARVSLLMKIENLFVASTYGSILARIAETALAKADLYLSTKVTSFTSDVSNPQKPKVTLTTADSLVPQAFDDVIITAPLGWLKRNLGAFNPLLPPRLTQALNNASYGRLEKVYISFEKAFWHDQNSNTPFFTKFLCPAFAPLQNPYRWTLEPVSLASLPEATAQPSLLFYLNGPCSAHVTSMISSLQANSSEYYDRLTEFFHPYYSLLPNYDATSPICQPVKVLSTDWQHDELAGWGSYTNFQVSTVSPKKWHQLGGDEVEIDPKNAAAADASRNTASTRTESTEENDDQERVDDEVHIDKDIQVLRQGCPERGIWFAGEHTAPFVALGTTTGAYWSGEAVGRRVLAAYGLGTYEDALDIEHEGLRMTATNGSASVKNEASVDRMGNTGAVETLG